MDAEIFAVIARYAGLALTTGLGILGTVRETRVKVQNTEQLTRTGWLTVILIILSSTIGAIGQYADDRVKRREDERRSRLQIDALKKTDAILANARRSLLPFSRKLSHYTVLLLPADTPAVKSLRDLFPHADARMLDTPTTRDRYDRAIRRSLAPLFQDSRLIIELGARGHEQGVISAVVPLSIPRHRDDQFTAAMEPDGSVRIGFRGELPIEWNRAVLSLLDFGGMRTTATFASFPAGAIVEQVNLVDDRYVQRLRLPLASRGDFLGMKIFDGQLPEDVSPGAENGWH